MTRIIGIDCAVRAERVGLAQREGWMWVGDRKGD
jgi:hypothetical protein